MLLSGQEFEKKLKTEKESKRPEEARARIQEAEDQDPVLNMPTNSLCDPNN